MAGPRRLPAISYHEEIGRFAQGGEEDNGSLTVVAVSEHAWRLRLGDGWIVTVSDGPYLGPLAVRVACFPWGVRPKPGTHAHIFPDLLRLESVDIDLRAAMGWNGIDGVSPPPCRNDRRRPPVDEDAELSVKDEARALGRGLAAYDLDALLGAAYALIGRGPGLTPEGDDVLCGFMAGLHAALRKSPHPGLAALMTALVQFVDEQAQQRTTSLSRTLLHYAGRGVVGEPLQWVISGLLEAARVGANSGAERCSSPSTDKGDGLIASSSTVGAILRSPVMSRLTRSEIEAPGPAGERRSPLHLQHQGGAVGAVSPTTLLSMVSRDALDRLRALGHTSGRAMLAGALIAIGVVTGGAGE